MLRRVLSLLGVTAVVLGIAAFARQEPTKSDFPFLEWALKATPEIPPVAVLIELGLKDTEPTNWSGQVKVSGAEVVHREGYRFRDGDKLVPPEGWEAQSRRPIRVPRGQPAVARQAGIDTVGVVLHLADIQDEACLNLDVQGKFTKVPLEKVLRGERFPILDGKGVVRLVTTATPIANGDAEDDFPAAAFAPDGTLWVAYISYHLKDKERRIEQKPLDAQPASFKDYYRPEFGDQLFVKYYRNGRWSKPAALTGPSEDLIRCAIAVEGNGEVTVAYAANRNGNTDIYTQTSFSTLADPPGFGKPVKISAGPGPHLNPQLVSHGSGMIRLCWTTRNAKDQSEIHSRFLHEGKQDWVSTNFDPSPWHPSVAAGPNGRSALAYDRYAHGDYDVMLFEAVHKKLPTGSSSSVKSITATYTSRFEARPSVCYDDQGRLWAAFEEGPVLWGKDYGAFELNDGNPLYNSRAVRVICVDSDGTLKQPAAPLPKSEGWEGHPEVGGRLPKYEAALRYAYPRIGIDGKGRVWLTYRQKFGTRYSTQPGSYWLTFARRLDGDRWSEPIEVHHSDGLLDSRPVLLPHVNGGLIIVHNTDGRYTTPGTLDNQVYLSVIDLPGDPEDPKLVPYHHGEKDPKLVARARQESEAVQRIRGYRIEVGGKTYRPLRGEFHRHTEMSWDGGPDGSLEDMFRYGIDAVGFDWIGNGDHDNGAGREYSWWLTQKFTDAYHVKDRFTPMFSYERSVPYPHGHRNAIFAQRGVRTLPRLAEPEQMKRVGGVHADDAKMFYRYLHELKGICASHTCATNMGTDWRDHDPAVEPIVEIYQGDRMSYEYEGCPRAGYDPKGDKLPHQIGGWQPLGFLTNAFKKGFRLGFQASSDHWSTHISYCIALAERFDREGILDALRKRHCYGATDDIILDVRSGPYIMGDEFKTSDPPSLQINAVGTQAIARVDVLKDSKVVHAFEPMQREFKAEWTDPEPTPGMHYYYVRITQVDDELAWGSPMWIEFAR